MLEFIPRFDLTQMLIGLAIAGAIAAAGWRLRSLAPSGAVAAALLGALTFGIGGLPAAVLLVVFFVSSSLLTRLFAKRKRALAKTFSKGGRRDWAQVLANGGPALLVLLLAGLDWLPVSLGWLCFAAALASVNADTWATELGVLSAAAPRLITTGRSVPKGTSGGISAAGSLAAAAGALLIGAVGAALVRVDVLPFLLTVTTAGLLGACFDSLLGATVQAIYYCPKCKKETERHPLHTCGTQTQLRRGLAWMDNDLVNFLSALFGVLVALAAAAFWL